MKSNWPDNIGVGLSVRVSTGSGVANAKIVDVKAGPSLLAKLPVPAAIDDFEYVPGGTLHLKLDLGNGITKWTDPTDGEEFVAWAIAQRKKDVIYEITDGNKESS